MVQPYLDELPQGSQALPRLQKDRTPLNERYFTMLEIMDWIGASGARFVGTMLFVIVLGTIAVEIIKAVKGKS